jgi:hypothetical protein
VTATCAYGLAFDGRSVALSTTRGGDPVVRLSLLSAFDRVDGVDETLGIETRVDGDTIEVVRRSTAWERASSTSVRESVQ